MSDSEPDSDSEPASDSDSELSSGSDSQESDADEINEASVHEPAGRRGACSFVHLEQVYLFQGYEGGAALAQRPQRSLTVLDPQAGRWSSVSTSGEVLPKIISGACCAVMNDCLYTFGGWIAGFRNADVHELDLETLVWRKLEPDNPGKGPFLKDKAGMVAYGEEMLCVFGGYGYPSESHITQGGYRGQEGASYNWDPDSFQGICWTNELHLFHVKRRMWISPETTGSRPPPCAAFTFTRVDPCRVVVFGGRQIGGRVNELHILNMENWHWSGAIIASSPSEPWPPPRSFHVACSLVDPACVKCPTSHHPGVGNMEWLPCDPPNLTPSPEECHQQPRMFVLWGMNNDADPLSDAWILNISSLTWKEVCLPACCGVGRVWCTAAAVYPSVGEGKVVVFGGSPQNLFKQSEIRTVNVQGTTLLHFGVSPLFQLCLEHIAAHPSLYASLTHCLSVHLQQKIEHVCKRQANYSHFRTARL